MVSFLNEDGFFIIAEIGGNHEGRFDYAKKLLIDAVESGADAVKFQTYRGDKIVSKVEGPVRNKHFKKFELSDEQWIDLAELAHAKGIKFMSSCWDTESLELLDKYIDVHKIGSGDVTNYPLIEKIVKLNKPVIISVAMSTLGEVQELVLFIKKINPEFIESGKLCLLHCVAMYGDLDDRHANLNMIKNLQDSFPDIEIGYSDHTKGNYAAQIAVGIGVRVLELHFTDNKNQEFRDHHLSVTKEELMELVEKSKRIKILTGEYDKKPVNSVEDVDRIRQFRRAVYPKIDLKVGDVLSADNLTTLRPNKGIDARDYYKIIGMRVKQDKSAFEAIYWEDLE